MIQNLPTCLKDITVNFPPIHSFMKVAKARSVGDRLVTRKKVYSLAVDEWLQEGAWHH